MPYSACFTGHRKILNSYYNSSHPTPEWAQLKQYLLGIISAFIAQGVSTFYSGMAIGVDTVAAEAVGELKPAYTGIELHAAIPFPSQPSTWPKASKDNYFRILNDLCDAQHVVSEDPFTSWKMIARDKFMVDNSHYIIAIWDGRDGGGTCATVKYAQQQNKQIFRIVPNPISGAWM